MEHPKHCPHCGAETIGTMQFCASCGKRVTDSAPAAPARPSISPLKFGAIVVGILVVICVVFNLIGGRTTGPASGADPISAFVMCKQFVTDRLKAPATAVFPTYGDSGTQTDQLSALQFRARAFVDSQNGFGANIRTSYTCTVTNTGGNNWHLDDLTTNP